MATGRDTFHFKKEYFVLCLPNMCIFMLVKIKESLNCSSLTRQKYCTSSPLSLSRYSLVGHRTCKVKPFSYLSFEQNRWLSAWRSWKLQSIITYLPVIHIRFSSGEHIHCWKHWSLRSGWAWVSVWFCPVFHFFSNTWYRILPAFMRQFVSACQWIVSAFRSRKFESSGDGSWSRLILVRVRRSLIWSCTFGPHEDSYSAMHTFDHFVSSILGLYSSYDKAPRATMMVPTLATICIRFQSEKYNEGETILSSFVLK